MVDNIMTPLMLHAEDGGVNRHDEVSKNDENIG